MLLLWVILKDRIIPAPLGPRFEFQGIKVEHEDIYSVPAIQVVNTSEIPATSYFLAGSVFISDLDNSANNKDIAYAINEAERSRDRQRHSFLRQPISYKLHAAWASH
jgi:hypothetical protein